MSVLILFAIFMWSCTSQQKITGNSQEEQGYGSISLTLNRNPLQKSGATGHMLPEVDSIEVYISGPDSPTLITKSSLSGASLDISKIPPGENKIVEARLFDIAGVLTYTGIKSGISISSGEQTNVVLSCKPLFSNLTAVFALGVGNPLEITSGELILEGGAESFSNSMQIQGEFAIFFLPNIKGDIKYGVTANLSDSNDLPIYRNKPNDSLFVPMGESLSLDISLIPQQGSFGLDLVLEPEAEVQIHLQTTMASLRYPGPSEIIFSEFMPEPDELDGGPEGEWIEIANRTTDSLFLDHCRISKTRSSNSISTRFDIPEHTVISPGKLLVFGREKAAHKDFLFEFKMVGTKQSLLLLCEENNQEILLDSISYTTEYIPQDSIFSMDGFVSTKRHEKFSEESQNQHWCLTGLNPQDSIPSASPGELMTNCDLE